MGKLCGFGKLPKDNEGNHLLLMSPRKCNSIIRGVSLMNQNDKNKLEKFGMTHNQIVELKAFLVERYVDNMSTKDLVAYVTDDLDRY